ncbi:MAG: hypothetical protein FJ146_08990 [Deltaproteobacteria bacterium]|nr:hypothetical protein [Deltaproteobacteria bacterium]
MMATQVRGAVKGTLAAVMIVGYASNAMAFEDTRVLPKGVRNLTIRTINTNFDTISGPAGETKPLAHLLFKELTFKQMANAEDALKGRQLRGFLLQNGITESESVGKFSADIKGRVTVTAPIAAIGITENMTLAVASPIYNASTSASVGFTPNNNANKILGLLARPETNQIANAREAARKLNDAVGQLNKKLTDNGFQALSDWHGQGFGDTTIALKYRGIDNSRMGLATTTGVVAPTGRKKDPNILNDVPFGEGVWAPFAQVAVDQKLPQQFYTNQYVKYTESLPTQRTVRAITNEERVEVPLVTVDYNMGNRFDVGTSLRYTPNYGLLAGVGYTYLRKFGDVYSGNLNAANIGAMQQWTDQQAHNAEFLIGYSTVPLYQAGRAAIPFSINVAYTKQLASRNLPISDLAQFNVDLFF